MGNRCNNCKFFMTVDSGYSNYTVTDTTVHCLKNANKYFPCEESYSWEKPDSPDYKQLRVAENCSHYAEGDGIHFDVDGDETEKDCNDQEVLQAYSDYNNA